MNLYCVYTERFSHVAKDVHTKAEVNIQGRRPNLNKSQTAVLSRYSLNNMRYLQEGTEHPGHVLG